MSKKRNTGAFVAGSLIGGLAAAAITLWNTPKSGAEMRHTMGFGDDSGQPRTMAATDPAATGAHGAAGGERQFSNPLLSAVEKLVAPIPGVELGKLAKDDPHATGDAPRRASAADARPPESSFDPREPAHGAAMATGGGTVAPGGRVQPVSGEPLTAPVGDSATNEVTNTAGETYTYRPDATQPAPAPATAPAPTEPDSVEPAEPAEVTDTRAATTEDLTSPPAADDVHQAGDRTAVNPDEEATHDPEAGSEAPAATTEELTSPPPEYVEQLEEERTAEPEEGAVDFPDPPTRDR